MSYIQLNPKTSAAVTTYTANFISSLAVSETISSATVTASVWSGSDPNPSSILSGSASISGTKVSQKITGGQVGTIYKLVFSAVTSASQTLQLVGYLAIVNDPV